MILDHIRLNKKQSIVACTIGHDILMTQGGEGWENNCTRKQTMLKQAACYSDGMNKHET